MSFDVAKVVRSPGCDHRHDEESRNGRDMKIDILEAYVWISEVFRVKSGAGGTSPLAPLYTGAGGHPKDTTIDRLIF